MVHAVLTDLLVHHIGTLLPVSLNSSADTVISSVSDVSNVLHRRNRESDFVLPIFRQDHIGVD